MQDDKFYPPSLYQNICKYKHIDWIKEMWFIVVILLVWLFFVDIWEGKNLNGLVRILRNKIV